MSKLLNDRNGLFGIWPDVLTPLTTDLHVDHHKLHTHVKTLFMKGIEGITVFGHLGEGPSFSVEEKIETINNLIKGGVEPQEIIVGASSPAIADVVKLIKFGNSIGLHGYLISPPYYFRDATDQGMYDFFNEIIKQVGSTKWRMYLHFLTLITQIGLPSRTIAELVAHYPRIIAGIVDHGSNLTHTIELARSFGDKTTIYTSNEIDLPKVRAIQSTGSICGLANFAPRVVHKLILPPKLSQGTAIPGMNNVPGDERINQLRGIIGTHPYIPALKFLLSLVYRDEEWERVRPPLSVINKESHENLTKSFKAFDLQTNEE